MSFVWNCHAHSLEFIENGSTAEYEITIPGRYINTSKNSVLRDVFMASVQSSHPSIYRNIRINNDRNCKQLEKCISKFANNKIYGNCCQ